MISEQFLSISQEKPSVEMKNVKTKSVRMKNVEENFETKTTDENVLTSRRFCLIVKQKTK